ncbi:MAG: hypothetical protein Q9210_006630, partial [Variospora velana]
MAPTPAKRITRSANANQSGKAATKRIDESFDSGYGGSERLSLTASPSDNFQAQERNVEAAPPAKKSRMASHNVRDTSPGRSKHRAEPPGLATSLHTTRKTPRKSARKRRDRFTVAIRHEEVPSDLLNPLDRQLQSGTVANTMFQQPLDGEVEHVRQIFSTPRSRRDPKQMQVFFNATLTYPSTDEAFKHRYQDLRNAAWEWAQSSFPVAADALPVDLMHLANHAPELMEYINATTASPSTGTWEHLLSTKRAEIIYSVLGKALEVHIFGEELFGATPQQKRKLQMADREMFDAD